MQPERKFTVQTLDDLLENAFAKTGVQGMKGVYDESAPRLIASMLSGADPNTARSSSEFGPDWFSINKDMQVSTKQLIDMYATAQRVNLQDGTKDIDPASVKLIRRLAKVAIATSGVESGLSKDAAGARAESILNAVATQGIDKQTQKQIQQATERVV